MDEKRLPKIIPLEPHYEPGASSREMALLLAVFGILYAAGLVVIILHYAGVIS